MKVLFPTKFEELSFAVVRCLIPLKRVGLEEIILLFVVDRHEVAFDFARGFNEDLAGELEDQARLRFEDWEAQLSAEGIACRHRIEVGEVPGEIRNVAREEEVDLVVSGRQHETLMEKVYLGGTSMSLLRTLHKPLLICKPRVEGGEEGCFARVLLATDFSDTSERAMAWAERLAPTCGEIDIVHVLHDRDWHGRDEAERREAEAEAERHLADLAGRLTSAGVVQTHLRAGKTSEEIVNAARDHESTLIVMGTTGRHGLSEMWLGSASHRVAELSAAPVLLVPGANAPA